MSGLILIGFLLNIAYLAAACAAVWTSLRALDWISGMKFGEAFEVIKYDPQSLGIYYGLRFLGVCILGASLVPGGV